MTDQPTGRTRDIVDASVLSGNAEASATERGEAKPRAGVVGVGAMGKNHARVYSEISDVDLIGVTDLDTGAARRVAEEHDAAQMAFGDLLESVDLVSVAVPTSAHFDVVSACFDAGVHVLVEKPIATTVDAAQRLASMAEERDLTLQVGHVERFNPVVETLSALLSDLDVIAVDAARLGPPVDRTATDDVPRDLMIHDVDVVQSILESEPDPETIDAMTTADGDYAAATMELGNVLATFKASRVTQKKVRTLSVTTEECLVEVDYLAQSVLIHRDSFPSYVTEDGQKRYRQESVVERPHVDNGEPLRHELEDFVTAVTEDRWPRVPASDGIAALATIAEIERAAEKSEVTTR